MLATLAAPGAGRDARGMKGPEPWLLALSRCAWVAALAAAACGAPGAPPAVPAPARPTFTFAEGRLGFGGRSIDFPCSEQALLDLLGPPSRRVGHGNVDAIWDELGVVSDRGHKGGFEDLVTSLTLYPCPQDEALQPRCGFDGDVVLPGAVLRPDATGVDLLVAGLQPVGEGMPWWHARLGRFALAAWHDGGLVWLNFAWRGPDPGHVPGPPLGPGEMFRADSRAYTFPFDELLQEVERRGNVSVLRHEIHGRRGVLGRSMFYCGAMGELARRLGWGYFVSLAGTEVDEPGLPPDVRVQRIVVGFSQSADPDCAREFPLDAQPDWPCQAVPHDFIFDVFLWPDGGCSPPAPAAGG